MAERDDLADIPDEVRDLIEPHIDLPIETLDQISTAIAEKRNEAVTARASSGIEGIWKECEEAYIGIDDANRGEFSDAKWAKPMSMSGPVTTEKLQPTTTAKSTVFLRLTARYVDAGKAKLCEILLPPDDKAFSITETPVPSLIKAKDDYSQVVSPGLGPLTRPAKPGEVAPNTPAPGSPMMATPSPIGAPSAMSPTAGASASPASAPAGAVQAGADGADQRVPLTVKDLAEETIGIARKAAKMAENRIYDWMVESKYTAQMRKCIFDAARLGVCVVKGPFPKPKKSLVVNKSGEQGLSISIEKKVSPSYEWKDPWNIYPDPACGEDISDGDYLFEQDFLSSRKVRALKKIPGYVTSQIDKVLEEGPVKVVTTTGNNVKSQAQAEAERKARFEVWYFYGSMKREEYCAVNEAAGSKINPKDVPEDQQEVFAIVTMINSTVVRAVLNPLDSGNICYHNMPWQRRTGQWAGVGVAEQIRAPQRILNAAVRAMLNNAGMSAGSQIVMDPTAVRPANGSWGMEPGKIWYKSGESIGTAVKEVFEIYEIPNVTEDMLKIIELAEKQAENVTSIPLVTQGQSGPTTPETYGAAQLQDNNANQLLRDIGNTFDDCITEPVVMDSYEWLLMDPSVPDEEKGDFSINAHGSAAMVERAIQDITLAQMGPLSLNPAYKIDPKRWSKEFIKSKKLDPQKLMYSQEEQDAMDKQPPPKDPKVQVAEIAASVNRDKIVSTQTSDQQNFQHENELHQASLALEGEGHENVRQKIEADRAATAADATVRLHELQMQHNIALLDYANKRNISLDRAKADLAKTAMTLKAQRDLNAADHAVDLHKHHNPVAEPGPGNQQPRHRPPAKPLAQTPGRAGNGKAFEQ